MARIRSIKPEFPQSESMGRVSRNARLLFVQLWCICDDHGRTRAASRMLASLLFPYDDDAPSLIDSWLAELVREGCIRIYEHDGSHFLEIPNWLKHQKIDKPSKPQFPAFGESSRILASVSGAFVVGREGKGREGKGEEPPSAAPTVAPEASDKFSFVAPEWVPKEEWRAFVEMRRKIRAPMTNHAAKLAVDELESLRAAGDDPGAVLSQSVLNSWRGLFAVKHKTVAAAVVVEPVRASHRPLEHARRG